MHSLANTNQFSAKCFVLPSQSEGGYDLSDFEGNRMYAINQSNRQNNTEIIKKKDKVCKYRANIDKKSIINIDIKAKQIIREMREGSVMHYM